MKRIDVIDSHTEGEPTRVVVGGGPDLGDGSAAVRRDVFRTRYDSFRSAVVQEPRGFDAVVGALLLPAVSNAAVAQVIFFNNVGTLGMCVHGTIGVAATLAHLGRVGPGRHRLETPAGDVTFELLADRRVSVENVRSYRHRADVELPTARHGIIRGDVAYGGNWFFLIEEHGLALELSNLEELNAFARDVRASLPREGVTGEDGAEIDHVELLGPPTRADADSRNFVLCPGGEYDRSPCGTGTSAKMACLAADGKLRHGLTWRQESILGTLFTGRVREVENGVVPTVAGRAWITAESTLLFTEDDPFVEGIRP